MKLARLIPLAAGAVLFAACDRSPTQPAVATEVSLLDPYALTFAATNGLPGEPFHVSGPGSAANARGPGAPFPDSLKLTAAQKTAIQAARDAFDAANAADLAALKAIHEQARAAMQAGKPRAEIRAIIEKAKPILDRLKGSFDGLHAAIDVVLTPAQKAWIAAHKPDRPTPHP